MLIDAKLKDLKGVLSNEKVRRVPEPDIVRLLKLHSLQRHHR